MMKKFLRRVWSRYSKLGKNRKKKQKWRKPTGRDNKMREQRKGYPKTVSIGYKNPVKKKPVLVKNISELEKLKDREIIIGSVGKKKKIEIAKKAKEMKISIQNLNVEKFLKNLEKINKSTNKK
tara:strand:+ start:9695 stop:10063 length:369 start_codon:yes stop_codon:yes gene_type:complete